MSGVADGFPLARGSPQPARTTAASPAWRCLIARIVSPAPAGEIYFRNRSLGRTETFTIPTGTAAVDLTIRVIDTWQQR